MIKNLALQIFQEVKQRACSWRSNIACNWRYWVNKVNFRTSVFIHVDCLQLYDNISNEYELETGPYKFRRIYWGEGLGKICKCGWYQPLTANMWTAWARTITIKMLQLQRQPRYLKECLITSSTDQFFSYSCDFPFTRRTALFSQNIITNYAIRFIKQTT